MSKVKLYASLEWLRLRFIQQRKSIEEMAKEARCSPASIRRALKDKDLIK
jgi:hypothetical protein